MGGVEVPQALRGWGVGKGIPFPLGEGSAERKFFVFFIENTIF